MSSEKADLPIVDAGFTALGGVIAQLYVAGLLVVNFVETNNVFTRVVGLERVFKAVAGGEEKKVPFVALAAQALLTYSISTHGAVMMRAGPGKMVKGYDNKAPRAQIAAGEITDARAARALAANSNLTEGFPLLLAAAFTGHALGVPLERQIAHATNYFAFRTLYYGFYLQNLDILRSTSFFLCNISAYLLIFEGLLGSERFNGFYGALTKYNPFNWPVVLIGKLLGK
ncbi:hypothetical protein DFJ74DRAFT_695512 [Hyaloraphidium curvatum]|nr:hypothetical protein DFJ74DRAFT_695512 [Hyaloraphidium curvatum]